jgi:hypothetical protein
LALAILFGVYPQAIFNYMEPSVTGQVSQLADWTRTVHDRPAQVARDDQFPRLGAMPTALSGHVSSTLPRSQNMPTQSRGHGTTNEQPTAFVQ